MKRQTVPNKVEVSVNEGTVQGNVCANNSTTTQSDGASENSTNVGIKLKHPSIMIGNGQSALVRK